ncbi:Tripartite tricarboxylate transporter family receptor [Cupriavidus sp. YR651]|nr:Tripartite tricarboxylate transporter family receptor [Cupriavidus sp. YR651]
MRKRSNENSAERQPRNGCEIAWQPGVVQNKPGTGGAIGFAELARATPDGYTIGFTNTPNLLTIPIEPKTTFTWKSYDLIGNPVDDLGAFTVSQSSNIDCLTTLVKYAKASPGATTVGTTGVGPEDHLAMLHLKRRQA